MTTPNTLTLRCSPGDPRFLLEKDGWDGEPREWTSPDVLLRPIWNILHNEEAYFDRANDVIGWLTCFEGEGPVATVRVKETNVKGGHVGTITVSGKTIEETFNAAVEAFYDLRASVPGAWWQDPANDRQREFCPPSDTFAPNDCPF